MRHPASSPALSSRTTSTLPEGTLSESAPAAPAAPRIGFQSTIRRDRVHRAALAETFLTGIAPAAGTLFTCGAQLPRSHAYFADVSCGPAHHDALLLLETVRQGVMAGAHEFHGIAEESKFVLTHNRIDVFVLSALTIGAAPAELTVNVEVTGIRHKGDQVSGLDFEARLLLGTTCVAGSRMGMVYKSPESYTRLRHRGRAEAGLSGPPRPAPEVVPVAPHLVGRRDSANVVLGPVRPGAPGEVRAELRVDPSHASMFDHPQDHVPGMVMNEAYRQLAILAAESAHALHPGRARLTRLDAAFTRFGELDLVTTGTATAGRPVWTGEAVTVPVTAALGQDGGQISTAEIELTFALGPSGAFPGGR